MPFYYIIQRVVFQDKKQGGAHLRTVGIVAEYNPFHNGHAYHIKQIKKDENTAVIAVLSGNLMQRGEFPLFPLSVRANAALLCGVDLVIELPAPYALQSAEGFALSSISLLNALGIVDAISFGAETADIDIFDNVATTLIGSDFANLLKAELKKGVSFPVARGHALEKLLPDIKDFISTPNNLLGIEYLKATKLLEWEADFIPIERIGVEHDSDNTNLQCTSASYLRKALTSKTFSFEESWAPYIPSDIHELYKETLHKGNYFLHNSKVDTALLSILRMKAKSDFVGLTDESEGLHHLLYASIQKATSLQELYSLVKSKRYTHSRIRRLVHAAILGYDYNLPKYPPYIHIMGASEKGMHVLKEAKTKAILPLSHSLSVLSEINKDSNLVSTYSSLAGNLYSMLLKKPASCGADFTVPFIKI